MHRCLIMSLALSVIMLLPLQSQQACCSPAAGCTGAPRGPGLDLPMVQPSAQGSPYLKHRGVQSGLYFTYPQCYHPTAVTLFLVPSACQHQMLFTRCCVVFCLQECGRQ